MTWDDGSKCCHTKGIDDNLKSFVRIHGNLIHAHAALIFYDLFLIACCMYLLISKLLQLCHIKNQSDELLLRFFGLLPKMRLQLSREPSLHFTVPFPMEWQHLPPHLRHPPRLLVRHRQVFFTPFLRTRILNDLRRRSNCRSLARRSLRASARRT